MAWLSLEMKSMGCTFSICHDSGISGYFLKWTIQAPPNWLFLIIYILALLQITCNLGYFCWFNPNLKLDLQISSSPSFDITCSTPLPFSHNYNKMYDLAYIKGVGQVKGTFCRTMLNIWKFSYWLIIFCCYAYVLFSSSFAVSVVDTVPTTRYNGISSTSH